MKERKKSIIYYRGVEMINWKRFFLPLDLDNNKNNMETTKVKDSKVKK